MKSKIHDYKNKYLMMSKTTLILLTIFFITISSFAQQGINYKAILKDTNGNVLSGTYMTVQFTIHQSTVNGTIVYQEDHNYTTDTNGLAILNIGTDASPSIGTFSAINWNTDLHFLQTSITYSGGTINFDATEFMAVPYAKHAETAANVFSGDYNDLINQPIITRPTGLEQITENDGTIDRTGWRLVGTDPELYGTIGNYAVDLSIIDSYPLQSGATGSFSFAAGSYSHASGNNSISIGGLSRAGGISSIALGSDADASGNFSIAIGENCTANGEKSTALGHSLANGNYSIALGQSYSSGEGSTALGNNASASGNYSTAIGTYTTAPSYLETSIGGYNTSYTLSETNGNGATNWNSTDRLFVIGSGNAHNNRSNALTILKNGNVGIGRDTPESLFEVTHQNGAPTSTLKNAFSIRNSNTNHSWQFYTATYLNLYKDGVYKGSWNSSSGAYVQASDRRVKKDISSLENGTLNKVMQLNPVSYLMKDQTDAKRNIGLISQEVKELFPSITHYVQEQDILSLSYTELIPILIKALQEQQTIIDEQNKQIETITADNSLLKSKDIIQDKSIEALVTRLNLIEAKSSN